jgi:site-specific recombinase XerD
VRNESAQFLAVAKLAETTKELYRHYLEVWAEWVEKNGVNYRKAKPIDLASFLGDHTGWGNSTQCSACSAVRAFYAWRFGKRHPILDFGIIREDPGPQRTPDKAKLEKLLAIFDTSSPRGKCFLAAVLLMLDTGLRASEVCRLDLEHLDLERGILSVKRKKGKWKPARFFDYTRSCLSAWLAVRPLVAAKGVNTVFVVTYGKTTGQPLNRNGLRIAFNRFGKYAEIGKFGPHDLRRAFATQSIDNGANARLVAEAGGWDDIQMLQRYAQSLELEKMREFSPVDRLMGIPPTK